MEHSELVAKVLGKLGDSDLSKLWQISRLPGVPMMAQRDAPAVTKGAEVEVFTSKEKAETEARNRGNCYVVKGTQMWNEPLGQVEEHNRNAPSKFFR